MKNLSMIGGLLMFLSERRSVPLLKSSQPKTSYGIKRPPSYAVKKDL